MRFFIATSWWISSTTCAFCVVVWSCQALARLSVSYHWWESYGSEILFIKNFYHHGNNFFEVLPRSSERLKKQALATFFGFLFEPWCIRAWLLDGTSFPTWRCSGVWSEIAMFLWTIECSSGIYELALYCLLGNLWNRFLPIGRSHRLQPIYCRLQGTRSSMD